MPNVSEKGLFKLIRAEETGPRPGDLYIEVNEAQFNGTADEVSVPTKLNTIVFGMAQFKTAYKPGASDDWQAYDLFVDYTVTEDANSHRKTVKITRSATGAIANATVRYVLIGYHYA